MRPLREPYPNEYAGLSRERASILALELTKRAAITGQTVLLSKHLNQLTPLLTKL